jgi:hypothetical protein
VRGPGEPATLPVMEMKSNTKRREGWLEKALLEALESHPVMPLGSLVRLIARDHDKPNTRSLHESAARAARRLHGEERIGLATYACPTVWRDEDEPVLASVRRVLVALPEGSALPPDWAVAREVWHVGYGPDRDARGWGWR